MSAPENAEAMSGGCLCGAVRFSAIPQHAEMDVCHCSMCRRWSGGVFMGVMCVAGSLSLENESALGIYTSSEWGERCFCKQCGSNLFWRMQDGSACAVSAQAFDDPQAFAFTMQIYVEEQPANYTFANETKRLTGAEVTAMFAGN